MKVLITGGARALAQTLAAHLLERGQLTDAGGRESRIDRIVMLDVPAVEKSADKRIRRVSGRPDDPSLLGELIDADFAVIFDLTTVGAVAGVTLESIALLIEIIRETGHRPKLVIGTTLALDEDALPVLRATHDNAIDGRVLRLATPVDESSDAVAAQLVHASEATASTLGDQRFMTV